MVELSIVRGNDVNLATSVRPSNLLWSLVSLETRWPSNMKNLKMSKIVNLLIGDVKHPSHVICHFRGGLSASIQNAYNVFLLSGKSNRK